MILIAQNFLNNSGNFLWRATETNARHITCCIATHYIGFRVVKDNHGNFSPVTLLQLAKRFCQPTIVAVKRLLVNKHQFWHYCFRWLCSEMNPRFGEASRKVAKGAMQYLLRLTPWRDNNNLQAVTS